MDLLRRHRRLVAALGTLLVLVSIGYVQRDSLLSGMGRQLVRADPLAKADAIVVLSGGTPERELAAADLYRAGWATRVVVTRVAEPPAINALIARGVHVEYSYDRRLRFLLELGVPTDALVALRTEVETTADEAVLLAGWCRERDARRLIVVTSSFHTRRAGYIFAWATKGQMVEVLMHPATLTPFDPDTWWHSKVALRTGLVELQKTVFYRLRYW